MTRITKAVFPVAGLGSRFLPATKAVPKEMLPVVARMMVEEPFAGWDGRFLKMPPRNVVPKPRQRPTGTIASNSISSASFGSP